MWLVMINEEGFSLIELIIGTALGVILLAASLYSFLFIKNIYQLQQALARIQENGRIIDKIVGDTVRQAGSLGCRAWHAELKPIIEPSIEVNLYGIEGRAIKPLSHSDFINHSSISLTLKKRAVKESEILWVRGIKRPYRLSHYPVEANDNQLLLFSDCTNAYIQFYSPQLKFPKLAAHANWGIISSKIYFIGKTSRLNSRNQPIYALYVTDINGRTLELIEGVEQLSLLYGIKQGEQLEYLSGRHLNEQHIVTSVRASLLLTSVEEVTLLSNRLEEPSQISKDRQLRKWWHYEWPVYAFAG